jgi:FKBP-type peptidyl-prolyl cis-trans isomerase FkpA
MAAPPTMIATHYIYCMKNRVSLSLLLVAILVAVGCKKFDPQEQADLDEAIITQYIADHFLVAQSSGSGLYWVIDSVGNGATVTESSTVTVVYKGYFADEDGDTFDESPATGATFPLSSVIAGWQEGIPKFKEGGAGMLLIPSALGYGNQEVGAIPANSVLLFDVYVLDVQ